MVEIKILGLKELDDMLKKLPEDFQIKAGWKSVLESAKVVRDKAIATVPVAAKPHYFYPSRHYLKWVKGRWRRRKLHERRASGTGKEVRIEITPGLIKRSIKCIRMKQDKGRGTMQYMIGPVGARNKNMAVDPFYWKFIEYGKRGYPPQRFLRNAFDSSTDRVIAMMKAALWTYIDNSNKKLPKYRLPT
jgi:HK97 gp10 family phage protein